MTHDAQVGDTVRMTITLEGKVYAGVGGHPTLAGWWLDLPNRTYEILERMLPTEPGYYLSESEAKVKGVLQLTASGIWWWIGNMNRPHPEMLTHDEARTYGHLRRLTVNA